MIKVHIDYADYSRVLQVWIVEECGSKRKLLNWENGVWTATEIDGGILDKPSLRFDGNLGLEIMQAMAEAFALRGLRTENDHKIQGTLEATKAHLVDLQILLKLKKRE